MIKGKNILISPLDWGLGHTTRCIPIAKRLQNRGHQVYFAVNTTQKKLLQTELNNIIYIDFEGYNVNYPKNRWMALKMLLESPKILSRIKSENTELEQLLNNHPIDLVISDNRFGMHSNKVPCVYITHQINIQAPAILEASIYKKHLKYIQLFDHCWIPDFPDTPGLANQLSHGNTPEKANFIGPLTRFEPLKNNGKHTYKYIAIISGPEPQRSNFEEIIKKQFKNCDLPCAIVAGTPENKSTALNKNDNISYFNHLNTEQLTAVIEVSENIICRPGYSSIMDLNTLNKPVYFIPTPGQTEQEYLAKHYHTKGIEWCKQQQFKLEKCIFTSFPTLSNENNLLIKALEEAQL